GLGAPVGSVLLGGKEFIARGRRARKRMGGAMRQAGIIAAGGLYALQNNISRLADDHKRAKMVEEILNRKSWIKEVIPTQTNIVVGILQDGINEFETVEKIRQKGILCVAFGKGRIRMTTHLDINDEHINYLNENLPDQI